METASMEASVETSMEASVETSMEVSVETSMEASMETSMEVPMETSMEASMERFCVVCRSSAFVYPAGRRLLLCSRGAAVLAYFPCSV